MINFWTFTWIIIPAAVAVIGFGAVALSRYEAGRVDRARREAIQARQEAVRVHEDADRMRFAKAREEWSGLEMAASAIQGVPVSAVTASIPVNKGDGTRGTGWVRDDTSRVHAAMKPFSRGQVFGLSEFDPDAVLTKNKIIFSEESLRCIAAINAVNYARTHGYTINLTYEEIEMVKNKIAKILESDHTELMGMLVVGNDVKSEHREELLNLVRSAIEGAARDRRDPEAS